MNSADKSYLNRLEKIRELLQDEEKFPLLYKFKFIVPSDKVNELTGLLKDDLEKGRELSTRPSSKGKYTSVTMSKIVKNADEVIAIYQKVSIIEGVISL